MKVYIKNIFLYIVGILCLIAFLSFFGISLQIRDEIRDVWVNYEVKAYVGDSLNEQIIYKGATLPIFGFASPLLIGIILVVETFKREWAPKLNILNTILAIILFICAVLVLLTKELFLNKNGLGQTSLIRNGSGPILSACCSLAGGITLLIVSWLPSPAKIEFIDK